MTVQSKPMPARKPASILPLAEHSAKLNPPLRASDDANSVCSSKSDKSRIDFTDKKEARAANPFTGVVGEEKPVAPAAPSSDVHVMRVSMPKPPDALGINASAGAKSELQP